MTVTAAAAGTRAVQAFAGIAWAYCAALYRSDWERAGSVLASFQALWTEHEETVQFFWTASLGRQWPSTMPPGLRADGRFTAETRNAILIAFASTNVPAELVRSFPTSAGAIPRWFGNARTSVPGTAMLWEWDALVQGSSPASVSSNIQRVFMNTVFYSAPASGASGGQAAAAALPSGTLEAGAAATAAAQRELEAAAAMTTTGGGAASQGGTATPGSPFYIPGRTRIGSSSALPWLLGVGGLAVFGFLVYWMVRRT